MLCDKDEKAFNELMLFFGRTQRDIHESEYSDKEKKRVLKHHRKAVQERAKLKEDLRKFNAEYGYCALHGDMPVSEDG